MNTRKIPWVVVCCSILLLSSCNEQEWGRQDPPAGNQVFSRLELLSTLPFDELKPEEIQLVAYDNGDIPSIVDDPELGNVLKLDSGYVRIANPLLNVKVQTAVSFTFWAKQTGADPGAALMSIQSIDSLNTLRKIVLKANGNVSYTSKDSLGNDTGERTFSVRDGGAAIMKPNIWSYWAVTLSDQGITIYVDGLSAGDNMTRAVAYETSIWQDIVAFAATAPYIYIGAGGEGIPKEWYLDDFAIYRNAITAKEQARPTGKIKTDGDETEEVNLLPVYFNSFEDLVGSASIVGAGAFENSGNPLFGRIFNNASGGKRANYLLLPPDALSHSSKTQAMTIGFWVNASDAGASADYMWAPMFMAYGAAPAADGSNTTPMLALQYRGIAQINNAGWCDFTDAQNVKGTNTIYHGALDWLADKKWHYYTATFTPSSVKIYFDGKIANEWAIDGSEGGGSDMGLFTNGADYKYICLGGNQAWNWNDNDPGFMFDDIAIYDIAMTDAQIRKVIRDKQMGVTPVYENTFEAGVADATIVGAGTIEKSTDAKYNNIFQNATGGMRKNYLLLPEDALSHSKDTKELTVGVWVNASKAGASDVYQWSPLFTAYGSGPADSNGAPMLALQYRGVVQVNCAGYCDFTDAQNVAGKNGVYHALTNSDWLADGQWHYYTSTWTATSVKVYFDGVLKNEWAIDGGEAANASGLFSNGADLKYICLGGNQAWNWGDPDPGFMFDDIAIYNKALTPEQIAMIISYK